MKGKRRPNTKEKRGGGRSAKGVMDNKLRAVYLKGYQAAIKSIIEKLKKQEEKIEAEIERCLIREEE